ncbi:MAG: hypothetical protein ACKO38_04545 [Planctomycetota bacterium]
MTFPAVLTTLTAVLTTLTAVLTSLTAVFAALVMLAIVSQAMAPALAWESTPSDAGAARGVSIEQIDVGLGRLYKPGCWTPVRVRLQGPAKSTSRQLELELELDDSDGVPVRYRMAGDRPVSFDAAGQATATLYGRFGRMTGEVRVRVREEGRQIATRVERAADLARCLPTQERLVVEYGRSWNATDAVRTVEKDTEPFTVARIDDPQELPDQWFGWEAVDTVLLSTSDVAAIERCPPESLAALDRWLRLGGHLIWCVGRRGEEIFAAGAPLASWCPGRFVEIGSMRRASALESYAGASQRLELDGPDRQAGSLPMTLLADVRGRVEASESAGLASDRPLIVRYPIGFGEATLVTVDMDQPPLSNWAGRGNVLARIAQRGRERVIEAVQEQGTGQVTHLGFDDLSGQLRGAMDQYAGATQVAFYWIAAILVFYIALIGPGDYYLLRFLGRPHWTWFTLPIAVTAFIALAYGLSNAWQERRVRINHVQVVDIDTESGLRRGAEWLNIHSPRSGRYSFTLEFPPKDAAAAGNAWLAWHGLPGKGLGGMEATAIAAGTTDDAYEIEVAPAASGRIEGLPIAVGGTRSLASRWWSEWPAPLSAVRPANPGSAGRNANVREGETRVGEGGRPASRLFAVSLDEMLQGECRNPLDVALTEWFLVFNNRLYRGDRRLEPGETVSLADFSTTRYLDWHLTRRRVNSDNKDTTTPWDRADQDVARIVEMMLFHDAAGGRGYSRLRHRHQAYADLSGHLRAGRAVLMGRSEQPAADWKVDGQAIDEQLESRLTCYRVVFPVAIRKPTAAGTRPGTP